MKKNLATHIGLGVLSFWITGVAYAAQPVADSSALTAPEQRYHDQIFDYVMDNIDPDKGFDWKTANAKGTIMAGAPFVSKSKSNCREFTEAYEIGSSPGQSHGFACQRNGTDGWCRMRPTDMQTCALENPGFNIGNVSYNISGPSAPNISMPDIQIGDININVPRMRMPSMPNMPRMASGGNGGGAQQNGSSSKDGNKGGSASGAAYTVTDTLGSGAAKGTGLAVGWFNDFFR